VKAFAIDLDICNGCYCCQVACKDEHCGQDWLPYAKAQPETGQYWVGLTELIRGQVPKVKITYLVKLCQQCSKALCVDACAVGAIYRREDGMVIIDPEKCTGCTLCVEACPHGNIFYNDNPEMGGTLVYMAAEVVLEADNNLYYNPYRSDDVICYAFEGEEGCAGSAAINDGGWAAVSNQEAHSRYADPLFVDPASADFHLTADSPAVDAGDGNQAVVEDAEANERPAGDGTDIGAYEYGE